MPNTINQQIESSIQNFVAEISALVRSAALDSVQAALGGGGGSTSARRGPGRPAGSGMRRGPGRPKGSGAAAVSATPAKSGKRIRRSTEDVEATASKFLAYVRSNDGKRLEEIAKGLSMKSADLKLPAQKLLAAKAVKTTGQKRGTMYHVGGGGGGAAKPAAGAAPAKGPKRAKKA